MTFLEIIINVYILTDEILKLIKHKHKTNKPKFSDVELITLIIFSMSYKKRWSKYIRNLKRITMKLHHMFLSASNSKKKS